MAYQLGSVWGSASNALPGVSVVQTPQGQQQSAYLSSGANLANAAPSAAQAGISAAQSGLAQAQQQGQAINKLLGDANNLANRAATIVNGTDADVAALRSLAPQISGQVSGINTSADALSQLAAQVAGRAGAISAYAPQLQDLGRQLLGRAGTTDALAGTISDTAAGLAPHISALTGMSEDTYAHGHQMVGRANGVLDQSSGLMALDPTSSAAAAEWVRLYNAVSPEAMAARAGADAQAQAENARGQMMRDVSRRGGSVTGGNALALQKQFATALAAARASAMTQGRQAGLDKQAGYLKEITTLSNELAKTGTDMFNSGIAAEKQGADIRKGAADIQDAMGSLYANAGTIFGIGNDAVKGAGGLFANAAEIERSAADTLAKSGSLESASADARNAAISGISAQAGIYDKAAAKQLEQANELNRTAGTIQQSAATTNSYLSNLNDANRTLVNANATLADAYAKAASYYSGAASAVVSGGRGVGGGGTTSTSTGRHYGVGGELLETGVPAVDAQLQIARDSRG